MGGEGRGGSHNESVYTHCRDFTKSLPLDKTPQGQVGVVLGVATLHCKYHFQILVDERLLAINDPHKSVYALGDCAQIRNRPHPCTAQVAEKQGKYFATCMGHTPTPDKPFPPMFEFQSWGMLAYVGGYKAIHDIKMDKSKGV